MADCSIGALGVLDPNQEFSGIVTERDLSSFVAHGENPSETLIADITNAVPVIVQGPIQDSDALDRMCKSHVRHLIVREGDDFRIVSIRDVVPSKEENTTRLVVRDVMSAPAIACRAEAFFEEVAQILSDRDISGMPVVDRAGQIVGVISERDLAHALGGPMVRLSLRRHSKRPLHGVTGLPRGARRAKDIMTTPAVTIPPGTDLDVAARLLHLFEISRIPVVEEGRLLGVVTRGDVLGAIAHLKHTKIDLTAPPVLVGNSGVVSSSGMQF
jgi:CBS domain-containing protein